jgi:hypothetical protein
MPNRSRSLRTFAVTLVALAASLPAPAAASTAALSEPAPARRAQPAEPLPPPPPPPAAPPRRPPTAPTPAAAASPAPAPVVGAAAQEEPAAAAASAAPDERFAGAALLAYSTDHLNLGIGARFGKTLGNRVYLGGTFVYNFGESQSVATPYGTSSASFSAFYVGPEAGYDLTFGTFVIRPYVGAGLASLSVSGQGGGASVGASTSKFVVWPGGTAIYALPGSDFFIGGDLRFVTIPDGPAIGLVAFGGMRFGS